MRRLFGAAAVGGMIVAVGCGKADPVAPAAEEPLTIEKWKALPPAAKYEVGALERLKQGEPKLMEQREWDKFTRDVLLPGKKRKLPAGGAK